MHGRTLVLSLLACLLLACTRCACVLRARMLASHFLFWGLCLDGFGEHSVGISFVIKQSCPGLDPGMVFDLPAAQPSPSARLHPVLLYPEQLGCIGTMGFAQLQPGGLCFKVRVCFCSTWPGLRAHAKHMCVSLVWRVSVACMAQAALHAAMFLM